MEPRKPSQKPASSHDGPAGAVRSLPSRPAGGAVHRADLLQACNDAGGNEAPAAARAALRTLPERGKRRIDGTALYEQAGEIACLAAELRTRLAQATDTLLSSK